MKTTNLSFDIDDLDLTEKEIDQFMMQLDDYFHEDKCECGGQKAKTTHSDWCPCYKKTK